MSQPRTPCELPPRAVIADDLTGSCDTAAQFSRYGMTVVVTSASTLDQDLPAGLCDARRQVDLLVVNTASRRLSPERAREVTSQSARNLLRSGRLPVYKKIDSTLKGPWRQEVAGVLGVIRPDLAIVAPAFPTWRRTTRGGTLYLDGQRMTGRPGRLSGSAGIDSADLSGQLRVEFGSQVDLMGREVFRQPPSGIEKRIQVSRRKGHRVLVFDAESDNDLRQLALTGRRLDEAVLWVGSAGLARFLPLSWGCSPTPSGSGSLEVRGPVLLICGSLNPANKAQLDRLSQQGLATTLTIQDEDADFEPRMESKQRLALETLAQGQSVALCLRLDQPIRSLGHLQRLQQALQSTARQVLDSRAPGAVILVGGDTALKVYEQSGARGIRILGEVEPGIPYGQWIGGQLDGLPVVTKAGGFGNEGTLCNIGLFLRGELPRELVL